MDTSEPYSVVIVTYNHAETLNACLGALQRLQPSPEIVVVVDNASTDNSADIAARWASDLRINLYRESYNTGFAAAINRGLAATGTPWVLLLNPDCAPQADFIAILFATLGEQPISRTVGSLTGKLLRADGPKLEAGDIVDSAGMVVTASGRHFDRGAGKKNSGSFDQLSRVFGGTGAATLFRRKALDDVAYPDGEILASSFFAYREDAELAWRLQWRGWSCLYVPNAVAAHRRGFRPEEGRRGHESINRHSVRNRFLLRAHCADLGWHLWCLPGWLIRDVMVIVACLTVERTSLPGLADVWRLRGDAWQRRRWVLGRHSVSSQRLRRWFRRRGQVKEITKP